LPAESSTSPLVTAQKLDTWIVIQFHESVGFFLPHNYLVFKYRYLLEIYIQTAWMYDVVTFLWFFKKAAKFVWADAVIRITMKDIVADISYKIEVTCKSIVSWVVLAHFSSFSSLYSTNYCNFKNDRNFQFLWDKITIFHE